MTQTRRKMTMTMMLTKSSNQWTVMKRQTPRACRQLRLCQLLATLQRQQQAVAVLATSLVSRRLQPLQAPARLVPLPHHQHHELVLLTAGSQAVPLLKQVTLQLCWPPRPTVLARPDACACATAASLAIEPVQTRTMSYVSVRRLLLLLMRWRAQLRAVAPLSLHAPPRAPLVQPGRPLQRQPALPALPAAGACARRPARRATRGGTSSCQWRSPPRRQLRPWQGG